MRALLYSALDLAVIISSMELTCREESHIIDLIWEGEKAFFADKYRSDKRQFILDIRYWMHYFHEKPILDQEFPAIQKDLAYGKHTVNMEEYMSDYSDLDLFFKSVRSVSSMARAMGMRESSCDPCLRNMAIRGVLPFFFNISTGVCCFIIWKQHCVVVPLAILKHVGWIRC